MNCNETRKWFSLYLDSELDPSRTFEVSQHLEQCDSCRTRFEQEVHADQLIAKRLRKTPAFFDWRTVEQMVFVRPRRWIWLKPPWMLAAAACVAFVVISLIEPSSSTLADVNPAQWAIDELHQLSPDGEPFLNESLCSLQDVETLVLEILKVKLDLRLEECKIAGHRVELVKVSPRKCPSGRLRVEVLLNCCGHPVLLTIGKCRNLGELEPVNERLTKDKSDSFNCTSEAYSASFETSARKIGNCVIIAVSPHHVKYLVSSIYCVIK